MSTSRRMFDESQIKAIATNPITDIDLAVGDITVDYNTTDGMSINSISKIVHQDGRSESPMVDIEIPIVPGEHINIDKLSDKEQVVIKAVDVCPKDLSKLPNPRSESITRDGILPVWLQQTASSYGLVKYTVSNSVIGNAVVRRATSGHIRVADNPTQDYFAVNKGYVDNKLSTGFKTLFGNQSIYGNGNIDLYEHDVTITGTNIDVVVSDIISSKNTKIDSLTDMKLICGDTFSKAYSGIVNGKIAYKITETSIYLTDGTTQLLSGVTFTDNLHTV